MSTRPPSWLAPGASSHTAHAPSRDAKLPAVDSRLVAPESRIEIINDHVIRTMGANESHAVAHSDATHLLRGCVADGYRVAVDMLTRADETSDMAPDVSVFPEARDPVTGGRQVEVLAVEVLDTQRLSEASEKADKYLARGVRRILGVRLANRTVYEWAQDGSGWLQLGADDVIEDVCLRVPLRAGALLDRIAADDAVAEGLLAAKNRVLVQALEAERRQGFAAGSEEGFAAGSEEGALRAKAEMLLKLLAHRGFALSTAQRDAVVTCRDAATLDGWVDRALAAPSLDAVFAA